LSFRFDTILRLNKNKEDLLQKDMGQINDLYQKQYDSKQFLQDTTNKSRDELNQRKRGDISVKTMMLYDNFFQGTTNHGQRQDTIISEINKKREAKREEISKAMQKSKILEILKERHLLKERKIRERKETAIQDEVASNLWMRNL
jgi:flagellar export protein FliJ